MENEAEYQYSSSVNEGILEISIRGELTGSAVEKLHNELTNIIKANEMAAIIKINGAESILVDIRALKRSIGISESYLHVRSSLRDRQKVNTAVVDITENSNFLSMYETSALSAGLSLKCFTDIDAARDWLKNCQKK